jgi:hypothetical protein
MKSGKPAIAWPVRCSDLFGVVPFLLASTVRRAKSTYQVNILPLCLTSPSLSLPAVQFLSV